MHKQLRTNAILLLVALIWGMAFVAQQQGMEHVQPFTFAAVRFFIGALALLPCIWFLRRSAAPAPQRTPVPSPKAARKSLLLGGLGCGIPLGIASAVQQIALLHAPAGKIGFLTTLYILFVPLLGLFFRRRVSLQIWVGVVLALGGMYLLCIQEGFTLSKGDGLGILCGLTFAVQILCVSHFSPRYDGLQLSCAQFVVAGLLNLVLMFLFENPRLEGILSAALPLLYTGILSSSVGYTLQIIAQKDAQPAVASLLMSLESVFSVVGGWIILHQRLTPREIAGCLLMLTATLLAQIPLPFRKRGRQPLERQET